MGRTFLLLVLCAGAAWADEDDSRERCDAGDAAACRRAATRAARIGRLSQANELRQRANALEERARVRARAESLADVLPTLEDEAPAPRDERLERLELLLSVPLVEADVDEANPDVQVEPPPMPPVPRPGAIDLAYEGEPRSSARSGVRASHQPAAAPGFASRFGVVGIAGGELVMPLKFGSSSTTFRFGAGPRFSLLPRTGEAHQLLPTVAVLFGANVNSQRQVFFNEVRVELLYAAMRDLTQANFTAYAIGGYEAGRGVDGYVGMGLGWNWLPETNTQAWLAVPAAVLGGIGLLGFIGGPLIGLITTAGALASAIGIEGFLFAGRIELRYFPASSSVGGPRERPLAPTEYPNALGLVIGFGA